MSAAEVINPALADFVTYIANGCVVAQVVFRPVEGGFELRHIADRDAAAESLRTLAVNELRALAQFTEDNEFRPLKSSPNLRRGWRATAAGAQEVGAALERLYPGSVPDWFAARRPLPPVTSYRDITGRQSGMYRITALLDDVGVSGVIGECCAARCCLKRRLWTVAGMAPDRPQEKSIIPCLEPCAVLLDAARKAVRSEQQEKEKKS